MADDNRRRSWRWRLAGAAWSAMRALRAPAADSATLISAAVDDLAEAVARQWQAEANVHGLGHLDPIRLRLSGDLADTTQALTQLPTQQLVVIGPPGAGKSTLAMLLTLGLVKQRQAGDPVPVLVTVSSWDPDRDHLDTWLVRRLGETYPALNDRGRYGTDAAVRLVDRGLVMPILDGLDEMPEPVRARAINALTAAIGRDRPLVLTSRAEEYQAAVAQAGSPLARAAVVEIEPITATDAAAYLPAGQIEGVARWQPVLTHLAAHPDGALAQALRTPLMVYLARTAYRTPDSDPAALLAFTDPDTIELHLLDAYLPTVYAPQTPPPNPRYAAAARPTYTAQQAHRWLAFLADHLTREQTTNLAWWRLYRAVPHFRLTFRLTFRLMTGLMTGLAFGLAGGLVTGLALGLLVGLRSGVMTGLLVGLLAGLTTGIKNGLLFADAALAEAVTPTSTLKNDRKVSLVAGLMAGPLIASERLMDMYTHGSVAYTPVFIPTFMFMSAVFAGSWVKSVVARVLLAAQARLPANLMPFLDDAYHRGVLRQTGAVYQFRHARLQQHLTTQHRTTQHRTTRIPAGSPGSQAQP